MAATVVERRPAACAVHVFNGPIEVGLRVLVLLVESFPEGFDLQRLITLDYLLVHSGDFEGGPPSLHPPSPLRAGEVAVRRELITDGLHFYRARALVEKVESDSGFLYRADEEAGAFLDALTSTYARALRDRAEWVFESIAGLTSEELQKVLDEGLGRWRTEFEVLGDLEAE